MPYALRFRIESGIRFAQNLKYEATEAYLKRALEALDWESREELRSQETHKDTGIYVEEKED